MPKAYVFFQARFVMWYTLMNFYSLNHTNFVPPI